MNLLLLMLVALYVLFSAVFLACVLALPVGALLFAYLLERGVIDLILDLARSREEVLECSKGWSETPPLP